MIKQNQYNILSSTLILSLGVLISRIIGFAYRIPIQRILGDEGNGLYGEAYQVYTVILTITAIAMPGALSKIIAQHEAVGGQAQSYKIFKLVLKYFVILALILGTLVFVFADRISDIAFPGDDIGNAIRIFAPSVIIATIIASFRGFFQGLGNMKPTASSQILEQIINVVVSVFLAYHFAKVSISFGVIGSCIGTVVGAVVALITLMICFRKIHRERKQLILEKNVLIDEKKMIKQLMNILLPVIISTAVFSIVTLIDFSMISRFLPQSITQLKEAGSLYLVPIQNVASLDVNTIVLKLKGQYSFQYNAFINIPISVILQLSLATIPSISADMATNNTEGIQQKIYEVMKIGLLFATPASIAFLLYGEGIIQLILGIGVEGGKLLALGGVSLIVITIAQLSSGILQGMGQAKISSINAIIACGIKIIFNILLISIAELNIYSVVISTFICYFVYAILNMGYLYKMFMLRMDWKTLVLKPLGCSVIMGMTSYLIFVGLQSSGMNIRVSMLIIIPSCIVMYYILAQKTNIMLPEIEKFVSDIYKGKGC